MKKMWVIVILASMLVGLLAFHRPPASYSNVNQSRFIISPADGVVKFISEVDLPTQQGLRKYKVIHIFIGVQNVHTQVYPSSGLVLKAEYYPTRTFEDARGNTSENEHLDTYLDNGIVIKQIAGKLARRIVAYHPVGSVVAQGEQLGKITLGSGCELFLPDDQFELAGDLVPGSRVYVGKTVLGGKRL